MSRTSRMLGVAGGAVVATVLTLGGTASPDLVTDGGTRVTG